MTHDGPSLLFEVFLVRLALQLEMFMSFLFPRLHPSFLVLLLCHLFALWSLTFRWIFRSTHCFMALAFFLFVPWISSIHVEWVVSSFHKVIGVHHVPCFIFDLNSSHDLPKLIWEFPVGVSLTKYQVSTTAYLSAQKSTWIPCLIWFKKAF